MKLVIAVKPSVAQSLAKIIGANKRQDGYLEGNGYLEAMELGELLGLFLQSFIVQICSTILSVAIFVIVYGRMN